MTGRILEMAKKKSLISIRKGLGEFNVTEEFFIQKCQKLK
jgi:hypothetical protein